MLASCGQNSAEYKKLKAENDSLRIENTKSNAEMDEILGTLNDVEADIPVSYTHLTLPTIRLV